MDKIKYTVASRTKRDFSDNGQLIISVYCVVYIKDKSITFNLKTTSNYVHGEMEKNGLTKDESDRLYDLMYDTMEDYINDINNNMHENSGEINRELLKEEYDG